MRYSASILLCLFIFSACQQNDQSPVVLAVYPSSDVLPENLLRMYVQFSQPMKTRGNLEKIKLTDEEGLEVKHVFFNNVYELWNDEQTQLTLILDPARVKTGLQANASMGRALEPDKSYTLVIKNLEDIYHRAMEITYEKKIRVVKADLQIPNTNQWQLNIPEINTKEKFRVKFPEMLDYQSLRQRLVITDADKKPVEGQIDIVQQETEWIFQPDQLWKAGKYMLYVNTRLEDPAGNNLNGLFDHQIGDLKYKQEGEILSIPFEIKD